MRPATVGPGWLARSLAWLLAGGLGVALGVAWFVAPGYIAGELRVRLTASARVRGLDLQIAAVYVEPTAGVLLDGVVIRDLNLPAAAPLARIGRLEVRYEISGLLHPKVWLSEVLVHAPRVHLTRGVGGRTNLDSAMQWWLTRASVRGADGEGGGLRRYLSRHVPRLRVLDLSLAIDDDKGKPLITPAGTDARHLRLSEASIEVINTSPVQETARFEIKGSTRVQAFAEPLLLTGQLQWPERAGWLRLELPGAFAIRAGGLSVGVDAIKVNSAGRIELGGVEVRKLGWDSPVSLDVRMVGVDLTEKPMALESVPEALRRRLPALLVTALRHVAEVTLEEPVIVAERPRAAHPPLPSKTRHADSEGRAGRPRGRDRTGGREGAKARERGKDSRHRGRRRKDKGTRKDRALGRKPESSREGQKVRDALVRLFTTSAARLQGKLEKLRTLMAMLPVRRVRIRHGRARYRDQRIDGDGAREVDDFNATIEHTEGHIVAVKLHFDVPGQGEATNAIRGRVDTRTGDTWLRVRLDRLPIAPYAALMPSAIRPRTGSALHDTLLTLRYAAADRRVSIDGKGAVSHIDADLPRISRHRITDLSVAASGKVGLDLGKQRAAIDSGRLEIGKVQVLFDGSVKRYAKAPVFDIAIRVPTLACQDAVDALIDRFAPMLSGMRCSGTMAFRCEIGLDTANMRSLKFEFDPTLRHLKIDTLGKYIDFTVLEGPFEHHARQPDGSLYTFVTGPGSQRWAPITDITEWMTKVVTTTEDGLFFYHKGFSLRQIRGAMVANLRRGRFVRGASTISQQTVKNLFFVEREKTISRKLQEAVVTWEMEHRLSKEQILELYFNIIEFGPHIYGIRAAANHYFARSPAELTPLQTIWLGSIIPGPRKFYHQFQRGRSGETWRGYMCWIGRTMAKREKITAEELTRLGDCDVVFGAGPDGSEPPEGEFDGLGHEGDPTLGGPVGAGEGEDGGDAVRRLRARKLSAPSVRPEDQP